MIATVVVLDDEDIKTAINNYLVNKGYASADGTHLTINFDKKERHQGEEINDIWQCEVSYGENLAQKI